MGTFSVEIQVGKIGGHQVHELDALVDTGSSNTAIPQDILRELGIDPTGTRPFRLADERLVHYPVGQARLRLMGQELIVLIVFMPEETMPLLGATTLETFSLGIDPVRRELISVPGLLK